MKIKIKKIFQTFYNDEDIKYFIKYAQFKLFYQIIFSLIGFLISWSFANFTSIEFYGTYLLINSIISFFSVLSFTGILQSLQQSVANGYDYFLINSTKKIFKYSITGTIGISLFAFLYSIFIKFDFTILISLLIISILFPFISAFTSYTYFLNGKGKFKKDLFYRSINLIIGTLFVFFLIFITKNLLLYFILFFVFQAIMNIIFTKSCIPMIENNKLDEVEENKAIKYGFFLLKYGFITLICTNLLNVIVSLYYGPSDLAIYIVGTGFINYILIFIKPSFSVLLTKYSKEGSKISKKFIILVIFGSILLFIFILLIYPLYLEIFFPKYLISLNYGIFYSSILLIYPLIVMFDYYFRGKVDKRVISLVNFLPSITFLILLYPLLLLFGIYGLILAEIMRQCLKLLIYFINMKKIDFC